MFQAVCQPAWMSPGEYGRNRKAVLRSHLAYGPLTLGPRRARENRAHETWQETGTKELQGCYLKTITSGQCGCFPSSTVHSVGEVQLAHGAA